MRIHSVRLPTCHSEEMITCQQSVVNSSQNNARRFCTSAGDNFHLAPSRSIEDKSIGMSGAIIHFICKLTKTDLEVASSSDLHPCNEINERTLCANLQLIPISAHVLSILLVSATRP